MASQTSPKRFALLVGVDLYTNDGSRRGGEGESLSLQSLQGCVNDVQAVAEFLRVEFQLEEPCILTSSLASSSCTSPPEPPDRQPTFENIKREFETVANQASPGDLFFFHFSGHGAELQPTSTSPPGRSKDPSLMTMDFCCGKPAVRGWQLNSWLRRLNEMKIRTIVTLDSCHSGGAWRTDGSFRTPEGWTNVANLPADEEAVIETAAESGIRDGEVETSWSINPDEFTLMTACESHEQAAERRVNGKRYGIFTYNLLACLQLDRPTEVAVTYRNLRDQIAERILGQNPRVYGRDRLVFFGDREPFSATPLVVRLEGGRIYLPIGKFHGVRERSEFTTYPPTPATFSVDQIDDWKCSAPVPTNLLEQTLQQHYCQVVPCRWGLGRETLRVLAHHTLGSEFQEALHTSLRDRIEGNIEITETNDGEANKSEANDDHAPDSVMFRMIQDDNGHINLDGSPTLIGYEGPVRGLDLTGVNLAQRAAKSAAVLAHLVRFRQVLDLRNGADQRDAPFNVSLEPNESRGGPSEGPWMRFVFRNTAKSRLYFTVLILSSGFHVKQLYPSEDSPQLVNEGREESFELRITVPDPLKGYAEQRDIIRIVVTRGRQVSWKSLELPDVWNADQLANRPRESRRDATTRLSECSHWVEDRVLLTTKAKRTDGDEVYWMSQ